MSSRDGVPKGRWILFWAIALGGAAFDLGTKSAIFARVGEPGPAAVKVLIPNVLELQTSFNRGALWGFGRNFPYSSLVFAAMSIVAAVGICLYLSRSGRGSRRPASPPPWA